MKRPRRPKPRRRPTNREILLSILMDRGPLHDREILDIWISRRKHGARYAPYRSELQRLCRINAVRLDDGRWAVP